MIRAVLPNWRPVNKEALDEIDQIKRPPKRVSMSECAPQGPGDWVFPNCPSPISWALRFILTNTQRSALLHAGLKSATHYHGLPKTVIQVSTLSEPTIRRAIRSHELPRTVEQGFALLRAGRNSATHYHRLPKKVVRGSALVHQGLGPFIMMSCQR